MCVYGGLLGKIMTWIQSDTEEHMWANENSENFYELRTLTWDSHVTS